MPETQKSTDGYNGEFWLGDPLIELQQVKSFKIPEPGTREQVEDTHLKTPDRRRSTISTFYEDSDFEVVLNSRLRSDTDAAISAQLADDTTLPFLAVVPEDGEPASQVAGTCRCIGYDRGTVENGVLLAATATFRVVTIEDVAAYVAP